MARNLNWWTRKLHRWGALLTALPLLIVIVSGLLLQVKKQIPWGPATHDQGGREECSEPVMGRTPARGDNR